METTLSGGVGGGADGRVLLDTITLGSTPREVCEAAGVACGVSPEGMRLVVHGKIMRAEAEGSPTDEMETLLDHVGEMAQEQQQRQRQQRGRSRVLEAGGCPPHIHSHPNTTPHHPNIPQRKPPVVQPSRPSNTRLKTLYFTKAPLATLVSRHT